MTKTANVIQEKEFNSIELLQAQMRSVLAWIAETNVILKRAGLATSNAADVDDDAPAEDAPAADDAPVPEAQA